MDDFRAAKTRKKKRKKSSLERGGRHRAKSRCFRRLEGQGFVTRRLESFLSRCVAPGEIANSVSLFNSRLAKRRTGNSGPTSRYTTQRDENCRGKTLVVVRDGRDLSTKIRRGTPARVSPNLKTLFSRSTIPDLTRACTKKYPNTGNTASLTSAIASMDARGSRVTGSRPPHK